MRKIRSCTFLFLAPAAFQPPYECGRGNDAYDSRSWSAMKCMQQGMRNVVPCRFGSNSLKSLAACFTPERVKPRRDRRTRNWKAVGPLGLTRGGGFLLSGYWPVAPIQFPPFFTELTMIRQRFRGFIPTWNCDSTNPKRCPNLDLRSLSSISFPPARIVALQFLSQL